MEVGRGVAAVWHFAASELGDLTKLIESPPEAALKRTGIHFMKNRQ